MDKIKLAAAFNLWMDEYINDPKAFEDTTASVLQHLRERSDGAEPSYGETCAATLKAYMGRIGRPAPPEPPPSRLASSELSSP